MPFASLLHIVCWASNAGRTWWQQAQPGELPLFCRRAQLLNEQQLPDYCRPQCTLACTISLTCILLSHSVGMSWLYFTKETEASSSHPQTGLAGSTDIMHPVQRKISRCGKPVNREFCFIQVFQTILLISLTFVPSTSSPPTNFCCPLLLPHLRFSRLSHAHKENKSHPMAIPLMFRN